MLTGERIVYGSMFSWQFFTNTNNYFYSLKEHSYPFFHFDLAQGLNALGDSQGSMLHLIKIVLAVISSSPYRVDSFFISSIWDFCFLATYTAVHYFVTKSSKGVVNLEKTEVYAISLFGASALTFGTVIYSGFVHPFFFGAIAYGVWILVVIDRQPIAL